MNMHILNASITDQQNMQKEARQSESWNKKEAFPEEESAGRRGLTVRNGRPNLRFSATGAIAVKQQDHTHKTQV